MEDYVYEECEVHGKIAWEPDRPWDAFWCCQADPELDEGTDYLEDYFEGE